MSIILITNHDENVYNIVDKSPAELLRQKVQEQKKAKKKQKSISRCQKKAYATMGVPQYDPPDPEKFLKKRTGKLAYPACLPERETIVTPLKPKVPCWKELLLKIKEEQENEKEEKNFLKENIKTIKSMKPKEPEPKTVIDRIGTKVRPLQNGWEPVHIHSQFFGKTPQYLVNFMQIREKEYQKKKDTSTSQRPLCRYITRDERERLLVGLKQNWEELQKQYQGLPILTDTIPKILRKSKLESDLKQLEKDVVLLERHPYIYVYEDSVPLP